MSPDTNTQAASARSITLGLLESDFSVCRFNPGDFQFPPQGFKKLHSFTSTQRETSLVCSTEEVPAGATADPGWRALYVEGPIPFGLTGVVAGITTAVADAGLPVFVVSTYDSDLLFLRSETLSDSLTALAAAGYAILPGAAGSGHLRSVDS